jgi:hypothetical protein
MGGSRKRVGLIVSMLVSLVTVVAVHAQDVCAAGCGIPDADILANPVPNVIQLYPDDQQLNDRRYQKVLNAINIYDAPNGNIVSGLDAGFNYITVNGSVEGWTEIEQGQWVESSNLRDVQPSRFAGITLSAEMPYPIAWIVLNVVPSPGPGLYPPEDGLALQRYTVVNIFATVNVSGWDWYQVGVGQWVEQRNIARVLPVERPAEVDTDKWVAVDLYEQVALAYEGTTPVFATLVSSGLKDWPTNEGIFHVYVRYPRALMEGAQGKPDFYSLQEVPWTQYFDNDIGLHGTYWHDGFGYRHSHGCVNLSITDAQWLYNWASSEIDLTVSNDKGAAVYVFSSGTYVN